MRSSFHIAALLGLLAGCSGQSAIKPAEVFDERTGMTIGALQEPIELVQSIDNSAMVNGKRVSFAYLGPIEWDRMGEITYGLWLHVVPGNEVPVGDIHAHDAVTLDLDDGALVLQPIDASVAGQSPYKNVVSWGQTAYFRLDVALLKRMAASGKLKLAIRSPGADVEFLPSQDTHTTLTQFTRARGITDD